MDIIIHLENDINRILVFQPGRFSQNPFANLANGLGLFINSVLRNLKKGGGTVKTMATGLPDFPNEDITITGYALRMQYTNYYLLTFDIHKRNTLPADMRRVPGGDFFDVGKRIIELEQELQYNKKNLQATVEELESSNEELQSSNEELTASNEVLQSTNEELQSVNEELYTVNSEYQSKIDELLNLNNDLDNLLINTDIGAIYLDNRLIIRKITPVVTRMTNLREGDIGRPISHITLLDEYPEWQRDVEEVQQSLKFIAKKLRLNNDEFWMVRIRPYRSETNSVEGIIITFVEIASLFMQEIKPLQKLAHGMSAWTLIDLQSWHYNIHTKILSISDRMRANGQAQEILEPEAFLRVCIQTTRCTCAAPFASARQTPWVLRTHVSSEAKTSDLQMGVPVFGRARERCTW